MRIEITGDNNNIYIGKNSKLNNDWWCIAGSNCKIETKDNLTTEGVHIAVIENNRKVEIGNDCMFSGNIELRTSDSHSVIDIFSNKRTNYAKDIIIQNHVWVCSKATVLKGVTIGTNSIIATGAVVTKNIPEGSVASGNPAKVVKSNISWDREKRS